MNDMGQFIDNFTIEQQDRDIIELEQQLERIKLRVQIKEERMRECLIEMTYHINELLKLKEELRRLD